MKNKIFIVIPIILCHCTSVNKEQLIKQSYDNSQKSKLTQKTKQTQKSKISKTKNTKKQVVKIMIEKKQDTPTAEPIGIAYLRQHLSERLSKYFHVEPEETQRIRESLLKDYKDYNSENKDMFEGHLGTIPTVTHICSMVIQERTGEDIYIKLSLSNFGKSVSEYANSLISIKEIYDLRHGNSLNEKQIKATVNEFFDDFEEKLIIDIR